MQHRPNLGKTDTVIWRNHQSLKQLLPPDRSTTLTVHLSRQTRKLMLGSFGRNVPVVRFKHDQRMSNFVFIHGLMSATSLTHHRSAKRERLLIHRI